MTEKEKIKMLRHVVEGLLIDSWRQASWVGVEEREYITWPIIIEANSALEQTR